MGLTAVFSGKSRRYLKVGHEENRKVLMSENSPRR